MFKREHGFLQHGKKQVKVQRHKQARYAFRIGHELEEKATESSIAASISSLLLIGFNVS